MNNETLTADRINELLDKAVSKDGLRLLDITEVGTTEFKATTAEGGSYESSAVRLNAEFATDPLTKLIALLSPEGAEDLAADLLDAAAKVRKANNEIDRQSGVQEKTALN